MCVCALSGVDRDDLHSHERAFWRTHRRLRQFQEKAKRDKDDLYRVLLTLRQRLPNALCGKVVLMAL